MSEARPETSRPNMPGDSIRAAESGRGLLPWSWAQERPATAHTAWLANVCPGGRPHAMPVWGVWLEGRLAFSAGSRTARNFAADPRCVITTERADPFSGTATRWRFVAP